MAKTRVACFLLTVYMVHVQEIRSIYTSALRQWLRTNLAWWRGLYRQRDVISWMSTYWLGRSQL